MPLNYFIFTTNGDWDSTTLYNNGEEFMADELEVQLQAGRDGYGGLTSGGLNQGGDMTAYVVPQGTNQQYGIFPGRLDLEFPTHKVSIVNDNPQFAIEFTQITLDGTDITNHITDLQVTIDAVNNNVQAFLTMYKPHFLSADEVATVTLI